jgi:hypothetical protein
MSISNNSDTIDSRKIIDRIEELEEMREDALRDKADAEAEAQEDENEEEESDEDQPEDEEEEDEDQDAPEDEVEDLSEFGFDEDDAEELRVLKALADEASQYAADWRHGATLIHEDYFTEYCEQMVEDIGDLPREIPSYLVIDWEATANNLRQDYTSVDFDGEKYLVR